jgi:hypothetical protein
LDGYDPLTAGSAGAVASRPGPKLSETHKISHGAVVIAASVVLGLRAHLRAHD